MLCAMQIDVLTFFSYPVGTSGAEHERRHGGSRVGKCPRWKKIRVGQGGNFSRGGILRLPRYRRENREGWQFFIS